MSKRGKIIILTAPSGSGKTSLAKKLLRDFKEIKFSVSATTRKPRSEEKNGVHYYFLTDREFNKKIDNGEFLEWEEVYSGVKYGTLKKVVENDLNKGYFSLLDIDVLGALNVTQHYDSESLSIFVRPPSIEELASRLQSRGSETDDSLKTRLKRAKKELTYQNRFDKILVNDDLEKAYKKLHHLVSTFINRS